MQKKNNLMVGKFTNRDKKQTCFEFSLGHEKKNIIFSPLTKNVFQDCRSGR